MADNYGHSRIGARLKPGVKVDLVICSVNCELGGEDTINQHFQLIGCYNSRSQCQLAGRGCCDKPLNRSFTNFDANLAAERCSAHSQTNSVISSVRDVLVRIKGDVIDKNTHFIGWYAMVTRIEICG